METPEFKYIDLENTYPEVETLEVDTVAAKWNYYEEKCGTIFMSNRGMYTFVCEFCECRFPDMHDFGKHLHTKHLNCDTNTILLSEKTLQERDEQPVLSVKNEGPAKEVNLSHSNDNQEFAFIALEEYVDENDEKIVAMAQSDEDNASPSSSNNGLQSAVAKESIQYPVVDYDDENCHCNICDRTFTTKNSFSRHKSRHKFLGIWPGRLRFEKTKLTSSKQKSKEISGELARMKFEQKKRTGDEVGDADETAAPGDPNLYCDICDRYYKLRRAFTDHAETHGNNIPKVLQNDPKFLKCRYCHADFLIIEDRIQHEKIHAGEKKPYRCHYCPKTFLFDSQLVMHEYGHNGEHPHPCQYCDKKFPNTTQRNMHERIHTKEKPYQCELCGENFRVSGQLFDHRKRHENRRDHECDICGKRFFSRFHIANHKVSHTNERPFECSKCGKTFSRRKALKTHEQLHSEFKRHECNICNKRFAQRAGLYWHKKTHGIVITE